jgi:hypothetical protein
MHTLKTIPVACLTALWIVAASAPARAGDVDVDKVKSFGTMGKERQLLPAGTETELFRYSGHGSLTHMWFGGDFKNYGLTRIRVYVDDENQASIEMELMGHGIGFQDQAAPWGVERIGKTGQPSGIYNTYRIPFGHNVRVTAERRNDEQENPNFWWIIRGVENLPVEFGGVRLPDNARLRLYKTENRRVHPLEEFDIYAGRRPGALYQVAIAAKSTNFAFLDSCVRAYMGGAKTPLLLSSGMEGYFLGTYYFNRGKYCAPVAGLAHLVPDKEFSGYRSHEADPVFFPAGLRLTIRDGEMVDGKVCGPKPGPADTVYTTYVWVYEW